MRDQIYYYAVRYAGDWNKIAYALAQNETWKPLLSTCQFVTIGDEEYPDKLRELRFPPWILFYEGKLEFCDRKSVGIVGSRLACNYGLACTRQICASLKPNTTIVSGLACGIDAAAHNAALKKTTIGVIGNGLDIVYPAQNRVLYQKMKQDHLVLSEYPLGVQPRKHHFPWRNRIIAALSDKLVIPQAKIRSGTLVTANLAAEMGKEIYCVPYRLDDLEGNGCNELLCNGAMMLVHFDELQ